MKFLTAQYQMKSGSGISLVIQHYEYAEEQVCFACIARRDDLSESLYLWFRMEALGMLINGHAGAVEKVGRSLRKQLRHWKSARGSVGDIEGQESAFAGVLCKGDEFIAFEQGDMGILYLNTAFGKAHSERLQAQKSGLEMYSGRLEKDVAILLATDGFSEQLREKYLLDSLFVGEMKQAWQMQKRLGEFGDEIRRSGVKDVGAILVRSCEVEEQIPENWKSVSAPEWGALCGERDNGGGLPGERTEEIFRKVCTDNKDVEYTPVYSDLRWGQKLGEGAFSQVYQVRNQRTGEVYACKKSINVAMLWREYCIGRDLEHPLFPKIHDFWQKDDYGFLLMEYVPGCNVKYLLERRGHFSVAQTMRVGMELAEGLLYLHEWKNPCLFRDVKPENIIIRQDGRVKLLDMGCVCAQDAQGTSRAGSPGFAAPEQFEQGRVLDVTCDVYGVAKTMEAMLGCGKTMFNAKKTTRSKTQRRKNFWRGRIQHKEIVGQRCLRRVIERCTKADPRQRIPDMRMLLLILAQLQVRRRWWRLRADKWAGVTVLYRTKLLCLKNIWRRSPETS